jgi:hypothetical protein
VVVDSGAAEAPEPGKIEAMAVTADLAAENLAAEAKEGQAAGLVGPAPDTIETRAAAPAREPPRDRSGRLVVGKVARARVVARVAGRGFLRGLAFRAPFVLGASLVPLCLLALSLGMRLRTRPSHGL